MENQQNLALMKEKLREKEREMRRKESEQAKKEEKVKRVLSLSQEKIVALKETVKEQHEKIRYAAKKEEDVAFKEAKSATEEGSGQDPKLLEEIEGLRKKNKELDQKTETIEKQRKKLDKEKSVLVKEYKKLKSSHEKAEKLSNASQEKAAAFNKVKEQLTKEKEQALDVGKNLSKQKQELIDKIAKMKSDPESIKKLQDKIAEQEKKITESIKQSEDLAKEKEGLIKKYEDMLYIDGEEGGKDSRLPSEIIEELKKELGTLKEEKKSFDAKLAKIKKDLEEKFKKEKEKLTAEMGDQAKAFKQMRTKAASAGEQVAEEGGAPGWMCTFADMVTLLMVFFILFFSVNKQNMSIMQAAIEGEGTAGIGLLELMNSLEVREAIRAEPPEPIPEIEDVESDATDKSKIVFKVPGGNLFDSGQAHLKKEGWKILEKIAAASKQFSKYKINIQGHTDDIPISSERFPTNWELSASRATAVLRFFIDKGIEPERLTATGYADIFPLYSNDTELGRSKNRRIEIILEKKFGY